MNILKYADILRNRNFALFWIGSLISNFGNIFTFLSLTWFILEINGQSLSLALMLISYELPPVFTAPFTGYLLDKYRTEKLLIFESLARGLTILIIPIAYKFKILNIWLMMILIMIFSGMSFFYKRGHRKNFRVGYFQQVALCLQWESLLA